MEGYWNRPHETARQSKGGRLLTGDIGLQDDEGFLYGLDRKDDVIASEGRRIYPRDLEAVLDGHAAVPPAVVGRRMRSGEDPVAYVQLVQGGRMPKASRICWNTRIPGLPPISRSILSLSSRSCR